jgi:hypothetical protein
LVGAIRLETDDIDLPFSPLKNRWITKKWHSGSCLFYLPVLCFWAF